MNKHVSLVFLCHLCLLTCFYSLTHLLLFLWLPRIQRRLHCIIMRVCRRLTCLRNDEFGKACTKRGARARAGRSTGRDRLPLSLCSYSVSCPYSLTTRPRGEAAKWGAWGAQPPRKIPRDEAAKGLVWVGAPHRKCKLFINEGGNKNS